MELTNSILISVISTIFVIIISVPAAYSFARFNTGGGHLLFITISTRMFPGVVAAIPFFIAFKQLGILDTHIGLTLMYVYFNMSFATFLLYGFFKEIPVALENAAMLDGYNRLDIIRKIILPLIKPGVAITTMFCLIWSWNEFLYAFLFTRRVARTAAVGLSTFWGSVEVQWGPMTAYMSMAILPTLLAAWIMQRHIVRGLTFGAVKGRNGYSRKNILELSDFFWNSLSLVRSFRRISILVCGNFSFVSGSCSIYFFSSE